METLLAGLIERVDLGPRAAVVGDIHGCSGLLRRLVDRLDGRPVVVAGDVCDRGPDSKGVLDVLVGLDARGVLGNHDLWLRDWALGRGFDDFALHPAMGGRATLQSYGVTSTRIADIEAATWRVPDAHGRWLEALPLALSIRVAGWDYWVLHAGLPHHLRSPKERDGRVAWLVEQFGERALWAKSRPVDCLAADAPVIMGHVPRPEPEDHGHCIAVDTGAGTWEEAGALTAVLLPERRFLSVRASSG